MKKVLWSYIVFLLFYRAGAAQTSKQSAPSSSNATANTVGQVDRGNQKSIVSSFVPGIDDWNKAVNAQQLGNMAAGIPILHTITQAIPSLRTLPGMNLPNSGAVPVSPNRNLNSAIEQFTAPIVRFATGGQPVAHDVSQFIQSIPNFIVNIPGFGDIDISKVDPRLIDFVLKGGQLPGVTKETMNSIIENYTKKVYEAAAAAQSGTLQKGQEKFLTPMNKLPKEIVANVMQGNALPGLSQDQTKTIMSYYTKSVAVVPPSTGSMSGSSSTQAMTELWKLLPPQYDLAKIPPDVIGSVMQGELPDFKRLPPDLMEHFKKNTDKLATLFSKIAPANTTLDDLLARLPKFTKPVLTTFSPYDINRLSTDMIHEEEVKAKQAKMKIYTVIALGTIGFITLIVLGILAFYLRRQLVNRNRTQLTTPATPRALSPPLANSTMRDGMRYNRIPE